MRDLNPNRVLVMGTGNFGTCLAQHLAEKGFTITAWTRSEQVAEHINHSRQNPKYLSRITLSERIRATSKIEESMVRECSAIVLAIPTQAIRGVLTEFGPYISRSQLLISAAKGIEIGTLSFPLGIIGATLGSEYEAEAVVLSGPSFAEEVVEGQPTAVSLGSQSLSRCLLAQELIHSNHFRAYTSADPLGLEVAGALKNIIAIASGAAVGIGFAQNSQAALLTRGLAEITRIGIALGANPLTFNGLGGVGDLFLTCTSQKSRNFSVGFQLGKGEPLERVLDSVGSVAEGVTTSLSAYSLVQRLGVDAPILTEVYRVLYEGKSIYEAVTTLLTREPKPEITLV